MTQMTFEETIAKATPTVSQDPTHSGCLLQIHPLQVDQHLIHLPDGEVLVGRDNTADICVPDSSVSRRHAAIQRDENGYYVSDLGSTNGTCVNEQRIQSSRLTPGDRVQFGGYIFKFLSTSSIELQYHEAVYSMMTRDGLTNTLNKRYFLDIIQREFQKAQHRGTELSMILFDIDHFKAVNDTHGHLAGDEVLKEIGTRISSIVAEHDVFARYGGEEFTVLLTGVPMSEAIEVAERCRLIVAEKPFNTSVGMLPVTISVGVAEFAALDNPVSPDELVQAADQKLYEAKESGRNRVCS